MTVSREVKCQRGRWGALHILGLRACNKRPVSALKVEQKSEESGRCKLRALQHLPLSGKEEEGATLANGTRAIRSPRSFKGAALARK